MESGSDGSGFSIANHKSNKCHGFNSTHARKALPSNLICGFIMDTSERSGLFATIGFFTLVGFIFLCFTIIYVAEIKLKTPKSVNIIIVENEDDIDRIKELINN